MDVKQKDTARIVKWPKEAKPIPPDSLPGAQFVTATLEATKQAHRKELRQLRESHAKERRVLYQKLQDAIRAFSVLNEVASGISSESKKTR